MALRPGTVVELVEQEARRFFERLEAERLRLYRALLQGTVLRVSPLTLDLIAQAGSSVAVVAEALPVPGEWPWTPLRYRTASALLRSPKGFGPSNHGPSRFHKLATAGVMLRDRHHPLGELGFWTSRTALEAVACPGGCVLQTDGYRARLHLPSPMPDTLLAALPGRPLEQLVSHPVLDGRGYVVERISEGEHGDGPVVGFATGLLPLELPWAEARGELAGGGVVDRVEHAPAAPDRR